jgi:hypothetical protein
MPLSLIAPLLSDDDYYLFHFDTMKLSGLCLLTAYAPSKFH